MIDKQNTDRKKKIFPVILLLCVIMGGTGLFYYKNKEDIASTVSKKETVKDRNSISSKKETVNEKNSAVEEYESLENGTNNSFSTYYNGYIYYKKGHVLYRRNMTKSHGMETDIVYYLQDEDANFVIMDGNIYVFSIHGAKSNNGTEFSKRLTNVTLLMDFGETGGEGVDVEWIRSVADLEF